MSYSSDHYQSNFPFLRWLGHVWASPNTVLGMLLGCLGRAHWQITGHTLEILLRGGPVLALCRRLRIAAFTLGDCVLYACTPDDNLRVHEGRHSQQYWLLGPFFLPVYFALLALRGYWNHPLEKDARLWEERHCGSLYDSQIGQPPPSH